MNAELRFRPFLSLTRREIKRFLKVIVQTIVAPLINSSLYLLIFGVSLGRNIDLQSGQNYLVFLLPGLIMMGCLLTPQAPLWEVNLPESLKTIKWSLSTLGKSYLL